MLSKPIPSKPRAFSSWQLIFLFRRLTPPPAPLGSVPAQAPSRHYQRAKRFTSCLLAGMEGESFSSKERIIFFFLSLFLLMVWRMMSSPLPLSTSLHKYVNIMICYCAFVLRCNTASSQTAKPPTHWVFQLRFKLTPGTPPF